MRRLAGFVLTLSVSVPVVSGGAIIESAASGDWSQASTWAAGNAPAAGDDVWIRAGHTVRYDVASSAVLGSVLINGALVFAPDVDTRLEVGLVVLTDSESFDFAGACAGTMHGEPGGLARPLLQAGAPEAPVLAGVTARIRLHYVAGADSNCAPGIISHWGRVDLHGAEVRPTWTKLAAEAGAGATEIVVEEGVNWAVGDRLIVVGTLQPPGRDVFATILNGQLQPETEERLVTAVSSDGRTITLDSPLLYTHRGGPATTDRRGEVANLSRNVVIESADPAGVRGHTMFHHESRGAISYAEFRHLGKTGTLGRYPVHYHLVKDSMRGSYVVGASIWDSANRWLAIHGTEFLVVRDTVGYGSLGHGFFLENGAEVYNLLDRNLGVQAYVSAPIPGQFLAYDENRGACYWTANARNFIYGNVFAECDNDDSFTFDYGPGSNPMPVEMLQPDGSRASTDVRTVSGGLVRDLEVHSVWGWGPWIRGAQYPAEAPLRFENTKVWDAHYAVDISGDNVVFDGLEILDSIYGVYNQFPGPHLIRNAYLRSIGLHGAFMVYRGGNGTMLYDEVTVESSQLLFRLDAKNEIGAGGSPITLHARNVSVVNPVFTDSAGTHTTAWVGSEGTGANVRTDPLLMLVNHDHFGPDADAIFLPAVQSETQPGVPPGLTFTDATGVTDSHGLLLSSADDYKYAQGGVAWPESPLENPVDSLPPATTILSPQPDAVLPRDTASVEVCGVAVDASGLAQVTVNGALASVAPNGVDWCTTLDVLSGGAVSITAAATDARGNVEQYPHAISVTVAANLPPELNTPMDQIAAIGSNVELQLVASDPDDDELSYTASGLPPGIGINADTGWLSGSPTNAGTHAVTVTVDDGHGAAAEVDFQWTVYSALSVNPMAIEVAPKGVNYPPQTFSASGGIAPYTWSLAESQLPLDMRFSSNGVLSGVPQTALGSPFPFTVRVIDSTGATATRAFLLTVTQPCCPGGCHQQP